MAGKKDNTGVIIGVAAVAVLAIGGFAYMQSQKKADGYNPNSVSTGADAAARIAESQAEIRKAELEAEVRKAEIKALDKPIGDRLFDSLTKAGETLLGKITL